MTDSPIRFVGLVGSLRKKSFNASLMRAALEVLPPGVTIDVHEIRDFPLYDQDVQDAGFPEPVTRVGDAMKAANGLFVASPEYNYGIPGVLKNAIDWLSRLPSKPLAGKPMGLVGASPGGFGTVRMQMQMRQVALGCGMLPAPGPELLVAKAADKFDDSGKLTDEPTRKFLAANLAALAKFTRQLGSA